MADEKDGIKLPGLEINYPKSWQASFSFVGLCAAIVLIILILFKLANPLLLNRVSSTIENLSTAEYNRWRYTASDKKLRLLPERRQFQFMTPSIGTWNFRLSTLGYDKMTKEEKEEFDQKYGWEQNVDSAKIEGFARKLIKEGISTGYRRFAYEGEGSSQKDRGLWWVVTVDTDREIEEFIKFYVDYWKPSTGMYIEEIITTSDVVKK